MAGEVNQSLSRVKKCLSDKQSFILEAGAGSGKTWTLIESLKTIIDNYGVTLEKFNQKVSCITFTNVAKDEIIDRIENNILIQVLTIHEFLWSVIKNYQSNLKAEILEINKGAGNKEIKDLEEMLNYKTIEYSQYGRNFQEGKITHEDVITLSYNLFSKYNKIATIVVNKYPYLFIDEYQDTEERTINLLLNNLLNINKGKITIGFFGDSMQKIYSNGVGKLDNKFVQNGLLQLITKTENYRCSLSVIGLLNKIRPELTQVPTGVKNKGELLFISCNNRLSSPESNYNLTIEYLKQIKKWNIDSDTKILLLTHRGIATRLKYEKLLSLYDSIPFGRDRLFNKEEIFCNFFLGRVERIVNFYNSKNYRSFIKLLGIEGFRLKTHGDKITIRNLINELVDIRLNGSVKEVLDFIFKNSLLVKPLKISDFLSEIQFSPLNETQSEKKVFYEKLLQIQYSEFISLNDYIEKFTPYSTKHGVKGAEYNNVLVVIDDSSWNQYKFNDVFANDRTNMNRYQRTLNLLYVCASRSKNNLTFLSLSSQNSKSMETIRSWFGAGNLIDVESI